MRLHDLMAYVTTTDQTRPTVPDAPFAAGDCVAAEDTIQCRWDFALRAPGVETMFAFVTEAIPECFPGAAPWPDDQPVNHPDSYTLKRYDAGGGVISVALKDKSNLRRSFVFMRFDGPLEE